MLSGITSSESHAMISQLEDELDMARQANGKCTVSQAKTHSNIKQPFFWSTSFPKVFIFSTLSLFLSFTHFSKTEQKIKRKLIIYAHNISSIEFQIRTHVK